jgi:hypothetical protein
VFVLAQRHRYRLRLDRGRAALRRRNSCVHPIFAGWDVFEHEVAILVGGGTGSFLAVIFALGINLGRDRCSSCRLLLIAVRHRPLKLGNFRADDDLQTTAGCSSFYLHPVLLGVFTAQSGRLQIRTPLGAHHYEFVAAI